jgi:dTMP kinase
MNDIPVNKPILEERLGLFITFEGIEGVGKSTQIELLADRLKTWGAPVTLTREPGGTALGNEIRSLLLSNQHDAMTHMTELLLLFAARAQHLEQVVFPALRAGYYVLCDRFTDATYAYQGAGRGLSVDTIRQLEHLVQADFRPDYTIILDAPPQLGLERAKKRGHLDRIEQEKIDFFERVRQAYLSRAAEIPSRYHVIDATQSITQVHDAIIQKLCPELDAYRLPTT